MCPLVLFTGECEFAGVERPTGTVEWTTGVEHWIGLLECHTHKVAHAHKMLRCVVQKVRAIMCQDSSGCVIEVKQ